MQFTIAIQRHTGGFQIAAPDLPGCLAVADSLPECRRQIKAAIYAHCAALAAARCPMPVPRPFARWLNAPEFGTCGWNVVSSAVEHLFAPPVRPRKASGE